MTLKEKVKLRAAELGLSMTDVADRMGFSNSSQLNQIYKNKNHWTTTIYKLSKALETDVHYFMEGE